jgi:hypothetical protein
MEFRLRKYTELPYYYQRLGQACLAAGILDEFYGIVDAGWEFGPALQSLKLRLAEVPRIDDVDGFLRHYGIEDEGDDEEWP